MVYDPNQPRDDQGQWSFSTGAEGIKLHHMHDVPTPTKFDNPVVHFAKEQAKITLPEGFKWSPPEMRAAPPKSETLVVKADGVTVANPTALPKLIEVADKAGETHLRDYLKGLKH